MRLLVLLVFCAALFGCAIAENATDRTTMHVQDTQLFLAGEITSQTPANFRTLIAANPQLTTVVLTSMSGSLDDEAMIAMGYALRDAGLNTHLTGQSEIYSGAVDLFLAGNTRTMAPGAVIGVHAWADGFGPATSYPREAPEHRGHIQYMQDMLGDDSFYWFTLQAAPPDEIHVLTAAEIRHFGLLTQG